jgi:hypothetical protein
LMVFEFCSVNVLRISITEPFVIRLRIIVCTEE